MKIALFIGFTLIIIPQWVSSTEGITTDLIDTSPRREILLDTVIGQVKNYWNANSDDSNSVVGRCLGLAKKIRSILPIAVFLMGVIMTLLTFLTVFSMKTLGLVSILLLVNTSGAVAKIASAFAHKESKQPHNVHFHVHKDDDHGYHSNHIGYSAPGPDWDRHTKYNQNVDLSRLESYNLYNKLLESLAIKNVNNSM